MCESRGRSLCRLHQSSHVLQALGAIMIFLFSMVLCGCPSRDGDSRQVPAPSISSLQPASIHAGASAFSMTVNGNGFVSGATVKWNGSPRTTTFVSSNQLSAAILSADVASQKPVDVMVNNPGSGASSPVAFSILPEWIFPSITALVPPQVRAGSTGMSVDVNGLHFTPKTVARWNGSDRSTEYLSSNLLRFVVPATDIANEGTAQITLYDPDTGTSDPVAFAITPPVNPVPVLTSISPAQAFAACAWFDMTVRGSNFVNLSYVTIDGLANFRTNYVSPEELTVAINATGALLPGNHEVKVHNLTPGGGGIHWTDFYNGARHSEWQIAGSGLPVRWRISGKGLRR